MNWYLVDKYIHIRFIATYWLGIPFPRYFLTVHVLYLLESCIYSLNQRETDQSSWLAFIIYSFNEYIFCSMACTLNLTHKALLIDYDIASCYERGSPSSIHYIHVSQDTNVTYGRKSTLYDLVVMCLRLGYKYYWEVSGVPQCCHS